MPVRRELIRIRIVRIRFAPRHGQVAADGIGWRAAALPALAGGHLRSLQAQTRKLRCAGSRVAIFGLVRNPSDVGDRSRTIALSRGSNRSARRIQREHESPSLPPMYRAADRRSPMPTRDRLHAALFALPRRRIWLVAVLASSASFSASAGLRATSCATRRLIASDRAWVLLCPAAELSPARWRPSRCKRARTLASGPDRCSDRLRTVADAQDRIAVTKHLPLCRNAAVDQQTDDQRFEVGRRLRPSSPGPLSDW